MSEQIHVRIVPMTGDHLDEVAELERICFTTPWSRNMLAEELDNYLSAFLVALDDNGKVAGYAGLQAVLDEGYITNVAAGCGLIRCAGNIVPFENSFPRNTQLYKLMTTKPDEAIRGM